MTSTVLECEQANLKYTAYEVARQLMVPECRIQIDPKYKRQLESIIRKPPVKKEQIDSLGANTNDLDDVSPCPFCASSLRNVDLHCNECQNIIPFCIVTVIAVRSSFFVFTT